MTSIGHTRALRRLAGWFDNDAALTQCESQVDASPRSVEWSRVIPFIGLHLACLAAFLVGLSATAVAVAIGLYALRMFVITGFYHRYFAHCAFQTSRAAQFAFALIGASAAQRGPLWWASHHRHHHAHSDGPADTHSALQHGLLWSHMGWFMARENFATRIGLVADFSRFRELRFLDRFDLLAPIALGVVLFGIGEALKVYVPGLNTDGWQLVVWGSCISTVVLYHATFTINSLAHRFGSRRYATRDDSRNNFWLAVITFGEGWHNNHHHYPGAARQGIRPWEIDITYYGLRMLAALGVIWDLKQLPPVMRDARLVVGGRRTS